MRFKWLYQDEANDGTKGTGTGAPQTGTGVQQPGQPQAPVGNVSKEAADTGNPQPIWPNDWREKLANGDDKKLNRLQRYASLEAYNDAHFALVQRMSAGELKAVTPFPDKGTPEAQNEWRKENGIPESHDKYDLTFDDGLVVGEEDKPIIDHFLQAFHNVNAPPGVVKEAVRAYYSMHEKNVEARAVADKESAQRATDALRSEWGGEYRPNMNSIHAILDTAPEGVKDRILNGRGPDGTPLGSDPDFLRFMIGLAREVNPVTTLTGGGVQPDKVEDEIASIEKTMREDRKAYNANEKMQQRYRDLLTAKEKMKGRAA